MELISYTFDRLQISITAERSQSYSFFTNFEYRWDLTRYPTSPVTQHVVRKYLNFGEFVYEKVEHLGKSVASKTKMK